MTKNKILISEKNRDSVSFAITCVFYLVLFVLFAVIPVSKPKKYTQISVQLDVPITKSKNQLSQKIEEQKPLEKKQSIPQKTEPKVVDKPVEKKSTVQNNTIQQKTQPSSTKIAQSTSSSSSKTTNSSVQNTQTTSQTSTATKKEETKREVVYQRSIEELMAENAKKKKELTTWDDSIFGNESSTVQSQNNVIQNAGQSQNNITQEFEGVAASSSQSQTVQTASESRFAGSSQTQVSSSTSEALNKISSTKYVTRNSSDSITYETSGVLAPRQLIYPMEPTIVISQSLESKVSRNQTVKISFIVKFDGSVDSKTIMIEPVGSLVPEIEAEIKGQIALWRFESGKSDGQAAFNYSINVK